MKWLYKSTWSLSQAASYVAVGDFTWTHPVRPVEPALVATQVGMSSLLLQTCMKSQTGVRSSCKQTVFRSGRTGCVLKEGDLRLGLGLTRISVLQVHWCMQINALAQTQTGITSSCNRDVNLQIWLKLGPVWNLKSAWVSIRVSCKRGCEAMQHTACLKLITYTLGSISLASLFALTPGPEAERCTKTISFRGGRLEKSDQLWFLPNIFT